MKQFIEKYKFICIFILIMNFNISIESIYPQILSTDSEGNILEGYSNDWNFDISHYSNILKYKKFFFPPVYKDSGYVLIDDPVSMFSEVDRNTVSLSWIASNLNTMDFLIERKSTISENWEEIGRVEYDNNSSLETKYKFVDHNVEDGIYQYRLKYSDDKYIQYYGLPNFVITKGKDVFEFYPAYPNPVNEKVTVSFYIPEKDIVSIFFLNGKDTSYILKHEPQERGFYKLTVDKKSLGFENEIKRLYINCKFCDKKKNFGDIQF